MLMTNVYVVENTFLIKNIDGFQKQVKNMRYFNGKRIQESIRTSEQKVAIGKWMIGRSSL